MKNIILTLALIGVAFQVQAQTMDTVRVEGKARKFRASQYFLIMFETFDVVDAVGKKTVSSRSYYFDKTQRTLSSVREASNSSKPQKGTQTIYYFAQNQLTKVTVLPSKRRCTDCLSEYYFSSDSLTAVNEKEYRNPNPISFVAIAKRFLTKVPDNLPWGYFEDETYQDGKKKRVLKQSY